MKPLKTIFFLFLLTLFSVDSFAQYTEVINSNRPGVSRSAFSVGTNVLQFEAGPYILKEEHTPLRNEVSGFGFDFAIRYGLLLEQLEINVEGTYQNDTFTDNRSNIPTENKRSNFKNFALGAKYLIYDPYKKGEDKPNLYSWKANRQFKLKSLIPAVAVYAGANFDAKDNPYLPPGIYGFSPKVMIATQNNFASGWVFVTNFVGNRLFKKSRDENGLEIIVNGEPVNAFGFEYILTLTKAINEQWVVFGEAHGINGDYYADNLFRLGGAYLWSRDFQLDTALTFNTKDTPSVFSVNFGASYRLDFHKDKKIDNKTSAKQESVRQTRSKKGKKKKIKVKETKKSKKTNQEIDFNK